jgi:hypothetical protein
MHWAKGGVAFCEGIPRRIAKNLSKISPLFAPDFELFETDRNRLLEGMKTRCSQSRCCSKAKQVAKSKSQTFSEWCRLSY